MNSNRAPRDRSLPKVALLIETSPGSGRDILKGIARYLGERGPWSIYHEAASPGADVPRWLRRWQGDGIIARMEGRRTWRALKKTGRPLVDVLGETGEPVVPLVHVDDAAIAELAARHLLSLGLRHFAYCGIAGTAWSVRRREGFSSAIFERSSATGHESREDAQGRFSVWLQGLPKPVGIMVCSDMRGVALLDACRRVGIAVPEQAAVIGVDNDDALCSVCDPPLTSVIPNHACDGCWVDEVAGFNHQEYLGVVFKARTGRTTAVFRREARRTWP